MNNPTTPDTITQISLEGLHESPFNPRKIGVKVALRRLDEEHSGVWRLA